MAVFDFNKSDIVAYSNGVVVDSLRVGYVSGKNLVVALPFVTGNTMASAFSFNLTLVYNINNPNMTATGSKFAFAITKPDDLYYKNYNGNGDGVNYNGVGDGCVEFIANEFAANYYDISGSVEKALEPNTQYVLWLFPNYKGAQVSSSLSYNSSGKRTYELTDVKGFVSIDIGDSVINAIPYIDNGFEFEQAVANLDNGTIFEICQ